MKCDEAVPSCVRCTSTGRKCDGYNKEASPEDPVSNLPTSLLAYVNPLKSSAGSGQGYLLQYFFEVSAPALNNFYSHRFWNSVVLQACLNEPCIKDLAITVGCLERSTRDKNWNRPEVVQHQVLLHHTRALKGLSTHRDINVLLIGCLMLMLCEDFRHNQYGVLMHLSGGYELLTHHASVVDYQLLLLFGYLVLHAPEFAVRLRKMRGMFEYPYNHRPDGVYVYNLKFLGEPFSSLQHAVDALIELRPVCVAVKQDVELLTRFHAIPGLTDKLNDWLERFNVLVSLMDDHTKTVWRVTIHSVRAYQMALHIASRSTYQPTEMIYNNFSSDFNNLMWTLSILCDEGAVELQPVLFFVACKWREVAGRRRAAEILRYRSQGAQGLLLARIADAVIATEEAGLEAPVTCEDVPEQARVRPVKIFEQPGKLDQHMIVLRPSPYYDSTPAINVKLPNTGLGLSLPSSRLQWENIILQRAIELRIEIVLQPALVCANVLEAGIC